jgi:hypothetical protein
MIVGPPEEFRPGSAAVALDRRIAALPARDTNGTGELIEFATHIRHDLVFS